MEFRSNKIKGIKKAVQMKNALRPAWPKKTELPIVAFCPIPFSYQTHCLSKSIHLDTLDDIYAAVANSGVNTAILGVADGNIPRQMAAAKRHNVKVMISANGAFGLQHACYNQLCDYIQNKDVVAWFSYDEPAPYQWGDAFYSQGKEIRSTLDKYWNQLTLAYGMTSSLDLNRISMFNLAAESNSGWAGSFGIPDAEYRKATMTEKLKAARACLDNLQTLFDPWIWSYDYYPIRNILNKVDSEKDKYEAVEGEYVVEYEHFFGYLGLYQDFTQTNNSDFWAYGMCMSHKLYNNRNWDVLTCSYPTPTEGALRFETFAALLYGAQGIVYYRYGLGVAGSDAKNPEPDQDNPDKYKVSLEALMAPISCNIEETDGNVTDVTLEKSEVWYNVKKINEEIKAFQNIFLGCTVTGHMQFSSELPSRNPQSSKYYIDSIHSFKGDTKDIKTSIRMISCDGYGVLLTSFTNNTGANGKTRHYVAVMNLDPINQKDVSFYLRKGALHPVHHLVRPSITPGHPTAFEQSLPTINVRHDVTLKEGGLFVVYWDE